MTRKQALEGIRVEVAKYGVVTRAALRLYVENNISMKIFAKTRDEGFKQYLMNQAKPAPQRTISP